MFFLFGLALMPLGFWLNRRRRACRPGTGLWPKLNLNNSRPRARRISPSILVLTLVNVVIVSLAAYRGVESWTRPSSAAGLPRGDGAGVRWRTRTARTPA